MTGTGQKRDRPERFRFSIGEAKRLAEGHIAIPISAQIAARTIWGSSNATRGVGDRREMGRLSGLACPALASAYIKGMLAFPLHLAREQSSINPGEHARKHE